MLDCDRIAFIAKLKTAFDAIDTDHDGELRFTEIKAALQSLPDIPASATDVEAWIQKRSDKSSVTFSEFAIAICSLWPHVPSLPVPLVWSRQLLHKHLSVLGYMTTDDIAMALPALGFDACHEEKNDAHSITCASFLRQCINWKGVDTTPIELAFHHVAQGDETISGIKILTIELSFQTHTIYIYMYIYRIATSLGLSGASC